MQIDELTDAADMFRQAALLVSEANEIRNPVLQKAAIKAAQVEGHHLATAGIEYLDAAA